VNAISLSSPMAEVVVSETTELKRAAALGEIVPAREEYRGGSREPVGSEGKVPARNREGAITDIA